MPSGGQDHEAENAHDVEGQDGDAVDAEAGVLLCRPEQRTRNR